MRYSEEIIILQPREKTAALLADSASYKRWQAKLESFEHISGTPGAPGAKSKIIEKAGGRRIEITETLTKRDFPAELSFLYEASGVWNQVNHYFSETAPGQTKWVMESEFRCRGWIRALAFFLPGMFKKATRSYMRAFKQFAENHSDK